MLQKHISRKIRVQECNNSRKLGKGIKVNKERQKSAMTPISSFKGVIPFLGILVATMFLRSAFQLAISIYIFKFIDDTFKNGFLSYLFLLIALIAPILGQPLFGHITRKIGGNLTLLIAGIISLFSFIPFLIFSNYSNCTSNSITYSPYPGIGPGGYFPRNLLVNEAQEGWKTGECCKNIYREK